MFHLFIALIVQDRAWADPDPLSDMREDSSEQSLESRQRQSSAAFSEELVQEQLLQEEALEEELDQLYLDALQQEAAGEQIILYAAPQDRWSDPLQNQIYDPLEEVGIPAGIDPSQLYLRSFCSKISRWDWEAALKMDRVLSKVVQICL